jgi:hypothetical protein
MLFLVDPLYLAMDGNKTSERQRDYEHEPKAAILTALALNPPEGHRERAGEKLTCRMQTVEQ